MSQECFTSDALYHFQYQDENKFFPEEIVTEQSLVVRNWWLVTGSEHPINCRVSPHNSKHLRPDTHFKKDCTRVVTLSLISCSDKVMNHANSSIIHPPPPPPLENT